MPKLCSSFFVLSILLSVARAQSTNETPSGTLDPTITGIIAGVGVVVFLGLAFLVWRVCRKEPVPDFAPPPLMIPELKMLFAVSNEATSAPKGNADVKLHIVDAQSIDAAREKYRDWWHGRTEKAPIAVV